MERCLAVSQVAEDLVARCAGEPRPRRYRCLLVVGRRGYDGVKALPKGRIEPRVRAARLPMARQQRLGAELEALAVGVADVLERGAPALVAIDHDLVLGGDLEYCDAGAPYVRRHRLHAGFQMWTGARIQAEVGAAPGVLIRQLEERRRLEAAPGVGVDARVLRGAV